MATAGFTFTTPVAQPQQVGVTFGNPISIDIVSGKARIPYTGKTATGDIPGSASELAVALTAQDFTEIMGIIIARAQALALPVPAGTITIGA